LSERPINILSDHEKTVGDIAREEGFDSISLSSEISPRIKMLQRATAVCTDAYLSPIVRTYISDFLDGFAVPPQRVEFMSSDGGLRPAHKYTGNAALLSGPAGGVVGVAKSCYDLKDPKALIGFDMVSLSMHILNKIL
jgi:5-oxoprolinase (ATP-hydrolysing)